MDHLAKLVALAALTVIGTAHATPHTVSLPFASFMQNITGAATTVGFTGSGTPVAARPSPALGGTSGWSMASNFGTGSTASGGVAIGTQGTVAVGKYAVPVQVAATASRAQFLAGVGKTVVQIGRAGAGPLGLLLALPAFIDLMSEADVRRNPDSSNTDKPFLKKRDSVEANCKPSPQFIADWRAWVASRNISHNSDITRSMTETSKVVGDMCEYGGNYSDKNNLSGDVYTGYEMYSQIPKEFQPTVIWDPASFDQVKPDFEKPAMLPSDLSNQIAAEAERTRRSHPASGVNPFSIDLSWENDVKVTGPATVGTPTTTVKETTKVNPDGSTTTTTTTTTTKPRLTYTGPKVNAEDETETSEEDKTCIGEACTTEVKKPTPDKETKPSTEETDLCKLHPDILACLKVAKPGELEATPVPDSQKTLNINPDTGWGPSGGTCPPPRTASVMGVSISMPFTMLCDFASAIKPLFIAFAWLSAALTFFGLGRKD